MAARKFICSTLCELTVTQWWRGVVVSTLALINTGPGYYLDG